jgi:salicylate hydroxylase
MAYRGTFTREQLLSINDPRIDQLVKASNVQVWLGPGRHAVFYPLRNHLEFNLVLM